MDSKEISKIYEERNYSGIILKIIALKENENNYKNFYTSLTFANQKYLETGDIEWLYLTGERCVHSNYEEIKSIIEFEVEKNEILFLRKHLSLEELLKMLSDIKTNKIFCFNDKSIHFDVIFHEREIYKIGSRSSSIFGVTNSNLHRMSDVVVGWSNNQNIFTPNKISEATINEVKIINPIESLIGFLEYYIPKELCGSICLYFPYYKAWLTRNRFAEGNKLEVGVCAEQDETIKTLSLLYKINKSDEILMWNTYKFKDVTPDLKENELLTFYQPVDRDIDTSLFLLVDDEMEIQDFSAETPYLRSIAISMDLLNSGQRKYRQAMDIEKGEINQDIISHRKALIASLKKETVLFTSGDQYTAILTIKKILDSARSSIKIIDPYFGNDESDWDIFSEIAHNIPVSILSCTEFRRNIPAHFNTRLNSIRQELDTLNFKNIFATIRSRPKCPFHDRFFIVDDSKVWAIGTSVNGLGKRDSSIIQIDSQDVEEIITRFNYYWSDPSPIHKEFINNVWTDFTLNTTDL